MAADLKVPPLVGVYGRPGTGKTADKIRAFPNAYYFATPGGLIPAVSEVGVSPRVEDLSAIADLDALRSKVEAAIKRDKGIKEIVIDDLSLIASKTERSLKPKIRDGRALYGAIKERMGNLFDDWRNYGLVVAVDCHEQPPRWKVDEDAERPHTPENRVSPGMPNLPGQQSAPEMIKSFDLFYRVVQGPTNPFEGSTWPWRYKAGPWGGDGVDWETKDRWGVATVATDGILPLNLGEILRWVHRTYKPQGWSVNRPRGYEKDEELVAWAAGTILAAESQRAAVIQQVAQNVLRAGKPAGAAVEIDPVKRFVWLHRDILARVEIERAHSPAAVLRSLGINLPS